MDDNDCKTRRRILGAAAEVFADCGYAGASVQHIVNAARVTKPVLYYYFGSKAGVYQALVDYAYDERFRLITAAAARGQSVSEKLVEMLASLFAFLRENRELMRIMFATAFAAPGEIPEEINYAEKRDRNFDVVHGLIKQGQAAGELDCGFDSQELAFGIYGQFNMYVMAHLIMPDCKLNRQTARRIVELFMEGATAGKQQRTK